MSNFELIIFLTIKSFNNPSLEVFFTGADVGSVIRGEI